eukprot:TRINITY_DN11348_c0_g1_i2.p1 TRINITY_DN11348_c0_g1~~TRINITY_DN11348_c0_g1_i2.p1  ORF type:complete len:161 (-),score=11.09 TRINITY_DN11348_c0_g1_i2:61-543(-)
MEVISKVSSIAILNVYFYETNLNDEVCRLIAQFLETSTNITHFNFVANSTKITDEGVSFISSQLAPLPLQQLRLYFNGTQITDSSVNYISDALRNISPLLKHLRFNFGETTISDEGIMTLIECVSLSSSISEFYLWISGCALVSDKSLCVLAEYLSLIHI